MEILGVIDMTGLRCNSKIRMTFDYIQGGYSENANLFFSV